MNNIPDILLKIVETKKNEVATLKKFLKDFKYKADDTSHALDFQKALAKKNNINIIAEIKKASPSAGIICADFNPAQIARNYLKAGVDAVSILTDVQYFKGKPEYITQTREILQTIPILRKDFIINPVQIYEARALGADSFLLISAILTSSELKEFIDIGRSLGMEPLVESHSQDELIKTIDSDAKIIGINNRNLRTFVVDLNISKELIKIIPKNTIAVSESGIYKKDDVIIMKNIGFNAILVGEAIMKNGIKKIEELRNL